jgi:predicted RNase H-like HicB family nuclease
MEYRRGRTAEVYRRWGGKTYTEALANVEIIIQEWIETAKELGRPIPAARGRLAFA